MVKVADKEAAGLGKREVEAKEEPLHCDYSVS
jgi:hypothetical protein